MNPENIINEQSVKMNFPFKRYEVIRFKDGITVCRVFSKGRSYILKCFENWKDTREISNYKLLQGLNVPTIQVVAISDNAILLEDIDASKVWRLAAEGDMQNENVGRIIAIWYKILHKRGRDYIKSRATIKEGEKEESSGYALYDESDALTLENINIVKLKTHTEENPIWKLIEDNFTFIRSLVDRLQRTFTYNDFYYTNMAVAKDLSQALMFDYNLLGKGYAYADIRNVTSSLAEPAKEAFLQEYGEYDKTEAAIDYIVSPLVSLIFACGKEVFPKWGYGELEKVKSEGYMEMINSFLGKNNNNPEFSIRTMNYSDLAFKHQLMNEPEIRAAIHIDETSLSFWEEAFTEGQKDTDEENFILCADGQPAGWIKLNGLDGDNAWLSMLVISRAFQHMGLGSFAVRKCEEIVFGKGFKKLSIHTTDDNMTAKSCYEKCGYRKTEYGLSITGEHVERMGCTYEKELV